MPRAARALAEVRLRAVLAGEEAAGQRVVGDDAEALLRGRAARARASIAAARREVVVAAGGLVARQAGRRLASQRLGQPRGRVVRGADRPHLALPGSGRACARASPRAASSGSSRATGRGRCGRSAGARSDARPTRGCSAAERPLPPAPISMPTLVAMTTRSRLPRLFSQLPMIVSDSPPWWPGHPARVDVGGVDEVEAGVDEGVEQRERGRLVGRPAEHVAAEAERRDRECRSGRVVAYPCAATFENEWWTRSMLG